MMIHPTWTVFVKDHSISFWEAVALAKLHNDDLVIILLDFEKAYVPELIGAS